MSRSTVDLPQPDGPRMQTNSPLPGRSSTVNETSRITVRSPNFLVTFLKSTTLGGGPAFAGAAAVAGPAAAGGGDAEDRVAAVFAAAGLTGSLTATPRPSGRGTGRAGRRTARDRSRRQAAR